MLSNLPQNIKQEVGFKGTDEIAKSLQRRMKYRVPIDTGWLRRSIMIEKRSDTEKSVVVHAFYAMAVEKGRQRKLKIPIAYFEQHKRMPDAPGQYVANAKRWITLTGKSQPFIKPAMLSLRNDLPRILKRQINKAISKSRKWKGG